MHRVAFVDDRGLWDDGGKMVKKRCDEEGKARGGGWERLKGCRFCTFAGLHTQPPCSYAPKGHGGLAPQLIGHEPAHQRIRCIQDAFMTGWEPFHDSLFLSRCPKPTGSQAHSSRASLFSLAQPESALPFPSQTLPATSTLSKMASDARKQRRHGSLPRSPSFPN
jgi:hypothetical protein